MQTNFKTSAFGLARGKEVTSQDAYGVSVYDDIVVGIVCDGVGSARAGKEAAQRTLNYLLNNFKTRPASWSIEKSLERFIHNINTILYEESLMAYERPEMLTTLSVVVIANDRLYGANVGDSPIYLKREGHLQKLSFEHTQSEGSHILTQAIGMEQRVSPYMFENFIRPGDIILLCSDGLSTLLDEEEIAQKIHLGAAYLVKYASKKANDDLPDDTSAVTIETKELDQRIKLKRQDLPIPNTLKEAQNIDGYLLQKPLAQNERTWLATQKGKKYVLKFPPIEASRDNGLLDLFVQEAWNAKRLKAGFFPKAVIPKRRTYRYYVMEYIEGQSLEKRISKHPLHIDQAVSLAKFLLRSSQYLLRYNLVHGDIKPENIILTKRHEKDIYKLVDFGSIVEIFSITSKAGTPSYLAPERFLSEPISESSEIFAIGVTLYKALTGQFPYGEIEPFQKPTFKTAKPPSFYNKKIPPWLDSIVMRAIEPQKSRRYHHYSEMLYDLEHPKKVRPWYDPSASLIEKEPIKVYKTAFLISLGLNFLLMFLLLK